MENSLHEIKEIQWDWDEDDNGDVVEFVVIDGEKYVDVSYFNQKLKEKEDRFELHKNTDAKTIQDQSDLIEELKSKIKKLTEEIDIYNSLTPDKADWMAQYLGLLRDTNDERSLLEKEISDLEAKLAESEKEVKDLEFRNKNLEHSLKVAPNANAGQRARIVELKEINHKLKQQLAEKEGEIKNLTLAHFESKTNKPVLTTTQIINQDKISFAVAELEKVKVLIHNAVNIDSPEYDLVGLYDAVSNQIEAIKEMK